MTGSKTNEEARWHEICESRDWFIEEQLTAIEAFLRDKNLYGDLVAYTENKASHVEFEASHVEFEAWCLRTCAASGIAVPSRLASEAALIVEKMAPYRSFRVDHDAPYGSKAHRDWVVCQLNG